MEEKKETPILPEQEINMLLSSAMLSGANAKECTALVNWALDVKIKYFLLEMVLTGEYVVSVRDDGEPLIESKRD